MGIAVACRRVVHIYRAEAGDVVALAGVDLSIAPGRDARAGRPVRVGQVDADRAARRADAAVGRADQHRHATTSASSPTPRSPGCAAPRSAWCCRARPRNLLPYATLHRNIWLAQRRAARTRGHRARRPGPDPRPGRAGRPGPARSSTTWRRARRQRAALAVGIAAGPGPAAGRRADQPARHRRPRRGARTRWRRSTPSAAPPIVVVTHDAEVGARLGRAVTIRDGRVGAEGRGGQDFAVVAGDGTVQLPPEVLGDFPPGTLFPVDHDETVRSPPVRAAVADDLATAPSWSCSISSYVVVRSSRCCGDWSSLLTLAITRSVRGGGDGLDLDQPLRLGQARVDQQPLVAVRDQSSRTRCSPWRRSADEPFVQQSRMPRHGTVSERCMLRRATPLPGTSERSNRTHQRTVVQMSGANRPWPSGVSGGP